jgi:hypothetical protein
VGRHRWRSLTAGGGVVKRRSVEIAALLAMLRMVRHLAKLVGIVTLGMAPVGCASLAGDFSPPERFRLYTHCGLDRTYLHRDEYWRVLDPPDDTKGFDDPIDRGTFLRRGAEIGLFRSESGMSLILYEVPARPADEIPCR